MIFTIKNKKSSKDKKGFVTPGEVKWLRGPLKFLLEDDFRKLDHLHHQKTTKLIADFKAGENVHANLVWQRCCKK